MPPDDLAEQLAQLDDALSEVARLAAADPAHHRAVVDYRPGMVDV